MLPETTPVAPPPSVLPAAPPADTVTATPAEPAPLRWDEARDSRFKQLLASVEKPQANPATPIAATETPAAPTTPVPQAPATPAEPPTAPQVLDPVDVATAWIKSGNPEYVERGYALLEQSRPKAAAAPQPVTPDWEARKTQLKDEYVNTLRQKYTERKPVHDAYGEPVPGRFEEISNVDLENPLFKELIEDRTEKMLQAEKVEFENKTRAEQEEIRRQAQVQTEVQQVRAAHNNLLKKVYTGGVTFNGENTASVFPKDATGAPNAQAVKLFDKIARNVPTDPAFVKFAEQNLANVDQSTMSAYITSWAWSEFKNDYLPVFKSAPAALTEAPVAAPATAPSPNAPKFPANLLGAPNPPKVDNFTPQSPNGSQKVVPEGFNSAQPGSPESLRAIVKARLQQKSQQAS